MEAGKISVAQTKLKMTLWNAEAEATTSSDFYLLLEEIGLTEEIVTRLYQLMSIGDKLRL